MIIKSLLVFLLLILISGCEKTFESHHLANVLEQRKAELSEFNITQLNIDTCPVLLRECVTRFSGNFSKQDISFFPGRDYFLDGLKAHLIDEKWQVIAPNNIKNFSSEKISTNYASAIDEMLSSLVEQRAKRNSWNK